MDRVQVVKMISLLTSLIVGIELCYKAYQTRQRRLTENVDRSSHRLLTIQRIKRKDCRFWEHPGRTAVWWSNFKNELFAPEEWNENFRMSKGSFDELCFPLKPFIEKQNTHLRKSISVEKQIAVVQYYLTGQGRYRKVGNALGIS